MRKKRALGRIWLAISGVILTGAIYLFLTALAPVYYPLNVQSSPRPKIHPPEMEENRLYIPAINVDVAIIEGSNEAVLEKGAWHRRPESGNPEKGGNFVLSAHRFQMGLTPQQTSARSPFYHIDKLKEGDKIKVDYNKKRYIYEIFRKYHVDRYAIAIENPSEDAKMTLYSCDLRGELAGREVIEARPIKSKI